MLQRLPALAALVLASLLLSHELVYILAHGTGGDLARAMSEAGHDRYWTTFVLTSLVVIGLLSVVAARQLRRLAAVARSTAQPGISLADGPYSRLASLTVRLWALVGGLTFVVFLIQENAERGGPAGPLGLFEVVAGEHAIATPVIAVVALLVAFVGAMVRWRRELLLEAARRVAHPNRRHAPLVRRPAHFDPPGHIVPVTHHGLRAPPAMSVSPA